MFLGKDLKSVFVHIDQMMKYISGTLINQPRKCVGSCLERAAGKFSQETIYGAQAS